MTDNTSQLLNPPVNRAAYSDRSAWIMARCSELAYVPFEQGESMKQQLRDSLMELRLEVCAPFERGATAGYVAKNQRYAVLAFRGTTKDFRNILTDIEIRFYRDRTGAKTARGFTEAFGLVEDDVTLGLRHTGPIIGHRQRHVAIHAEGGNLDDAATIATYAPFLGFCIDNYEPIAWAEELIEPACNADHPRLAFLYVMASQCILSGRVEAAVRYCDAGMAVIESGRGEVPFGIEGMLFNIYLYTAQTERAVDWCRSRVQSGRDTHSWSRVGLILSLAVAQSYEEAIAATAGLIEAAEATRNPWALSFALLAVGAAHLHADPVGALEAGRRGLQVAEDSGNRAAGTTLATVVARMEGEYGDWLRALHYIAVAIHNYHDSGNSASMRILMATLATILDRMGRYEPAATVAGCAASPFAVVNYPELVTATAHLRTVLGDEDYESLARKGETMTTAEIATYAYDQIDRARAALNAVSK